MTHEHPRAPIRGDLVIQRSTGGGTPGKRTLTELLPPRPASVGSPLPQVRRSGMERSFGQGFGDVRVHENATPASLGALAYTQGNDIHFAPGQYQPGSTAGLDLIGHELTHVVQQRAGRATVPQRKDGDINADPALESEADQLGARAARGEQVQVPGASGGAPGRTARGQCAIDPELIERLNHEDEVIAEISSMVTKYNKSEPDEGEDPTEKSLHAQIARLDEIEHAIYAWYSGLKVKRVKK